ncbi:MAG TPA: M20 family metallopeptidase [Pseudonocardiaceae bacterium]|nr:M20 family metallopeptidase [Pseudonocardiaceae bacterium]
MTEARTQAQRAIAAHAGELIALSRQLHAEPELGWHEVRSSAAVADALESLGFVVRRGFCDLETAFLATIGTGGLHIAVCAEYDALPGIGHACGHNLIAASAVGVAAGLAGLVDELGLTLSVIGTPAEEGGGGKIELLERGGFDGVHAALMTHPAPADVARADPLAVSHLLVDYRGRSAHAAAYPEQGRNALDAFTVAQVAIGLLRQQLPSTTRIHGVITDGGAAPNAIPEHTAGRWYVRARTLAELSEVESRVRDCFRAGALAADCELAIELESKTYSEFRNDEDLLASYVRNAEALGRTFESDGLMSRASTDMANVSLQIPAIHPSIGIDSRPAVNHQAEFAAATITPAAERALLDAATALSWTIIDVTTDSAQRARLTSGR